MDRINRAKLIRVRKMSGSDEFLIDKKCAKIIHTIDDYEPADIDVTEECKKYGCKYYFYINKIVCIDYKLGNILLKLLYNDIDDKCILFFLEKGFELLIEKEI